MGRSISGGLFGGPHRPLYTAGIYGGSPALRAHCPWPYIAGSCLLEGLLEHEPLVNEEILEYFAPQYLHTYCLFSDPSYNSCRFEGLLEHEPLVKEETLEYFAPQHLQ
jgi:hypothetical protein